MSPRPPRLRKGQRVHLVLAGPGVPEAGWATFVRRERTGLPGLSTPVFRFGRRLVRGYECWWVTAKALRTSDRIPAIPPAPSARATRRRAP